MQPVNAIAPLVEAPTEQAVQVERPVASANRPAGHTVQCPSPASLAVPRGQGSQDIPFSKVPAAQADAPRAATQTFAPAPLKNPGSQPMQAVDPWLSWKVFAAHLEQVDPPVVSR